MTLTGSLTQIFGEGLLLYDAVLLFSVTRKLQVTPVLSELVQLLPTPRLMCRFERQPTNQ